MDAAPFRATLGELREILTTIQGRKVDSVKTQDKDAYQYRYLYRDLSPRCGIPVACYTQINPKLNVFLVRGSFGVPFAPSLRIAASEYIQRINDPLPIGNWAIDLDTGEVRFKLGFCYGHHKLTKHLMLTHIDAACYSIDERVMGFVKLLNGGTVQAALSAGAPEG